MSSLAPWLDTAWQSLARSLVTDRLAHGLLLTGDSRPDLAALGERLLAGLLCEQPGPDAAACGTCRSCHLHSRGHHPDLLRVEPQEDSPDSIKVDAIRALTGFVSLSSHYGRRRVVLLQPADAMTPSAANALLKTLEEPPAAAVLVLLTRRPSALLPTVRSRCQRHVLRSPSREQAVDWLAEQGVDQPAAALALAGDAADALAWAGDGELAARRELAAGLAELAEGRADPVAVAERWEKDLSRVAEVLSRLAALLARAGAGECDAGRSLPNERWRKLSARVDWQRMLAFTGQAFQARRARERSLNTRLALEALLIDWCRAAGDGS